jgi:PTH1 family peptidyl-tRNA hydrolase
VCDDFNLPLGKLRVRAKGSHGGQNGLRNIQDQLGTDAYTRMRLGVGQPAAGDAVDFVLSKFKPGERKAVEDAVATAAQAALVWVRQGAEACMNKFNGGSETMKKESEKGKSEGGDRSRSPTTCRRRNCASSILTSPLHFAFRAKRNRSLPARCEGGVTGHARGAPTEPR